ncbi:LysR substrate-binding domain-containing protein [Yoonia sp. SS1-5]|uniref:LysR family transcriptional regulator n=1 Tax=Yoonia rhodophyticola TaxID=3137370 RepID=A0AAN0MDF4_9RHOB
MRNIDLTALRSFVAVADTGGVTKAAGLLNLTQSAVSMQLKRLEEALDTALLDRSARTIALSPQGEQLLSYARKMLALNDEIYTKLTATEFEGEIRLGVPHDIVYPVIPKVLQRFAAAYPRVRVSLISSFTSKLQEEFNRGELDVILTTEDMIGPGGRTLLQVPLVWIGAPGGQIWKQRPLRLAFEQRCLFRQFVQRRLDQVGIPWDMAVETTSSRTIEATVSADLAIHAMLEGTEPPHLERIQHSGSLPSLCTLNINMYQADLQDRPYVRDLAKFISDGFLTMRAPVMV